ncbi:MAG TPA: zf-TFIIB domain-containing protein [Gemmataceae bacterium]|nr:zf-TFIIB domain-containing protein [Gemmataceae bacterium]
MTTINCAKCGTPLTPGQAGDPCPNCGGLDRNISAQDRAVLHDKAKAARDLARRHFQIEPGITRITTLWAALAFEALPDTPIKLLEVNENTVPSGVMPIHFGRVPGSGVPFPSVIVEVTPEEFEKIKTAELKLPDGWSLGEELPKPSDLDGGG